MERGRLGAERRLSVRRTQVVQVLVHNQGPSARNWANCPADLPRGPHGGAAARRGTTGARDCRSERAHPRTRAGAGGERVCAGAGVPPPPGIAASGSRHRETKGCELGDANLLMNWREDKIGHHEGGGYYKFTIYQFLLARLT